MGWLIAHEKRRELRTSLPTRTRTAATRSRADARTNARTPRAGTLHRRERESARARARATRPKQSTAHSATHHAVGGRDASAVLDTLRRRRSIGVTPEEEAQRGVARHGRGGGRDALVEELAADAETPDCLRPRPRDGGGCGAARRGGEGASRARCALPPQATDVYTDAPASRAAPASAARTRTRTRTLPPPPPSPTPLPSAPAPAHRSCSLSARAATRAPPLQKLRAQKDEAVAQQSARSASWCG